jgi:hypothetical protein
MIDYICAPLPMHGEKVCATQRSFHEMRRALVARFGLTRREIAPRRALAELLPRTGRRRAWKRLGTELPGFRLPSLSRPRWLVHIIGWGSLALAVMWTMRASTSLSSAAGALFYSFLALFVASLWATRPLATCFPATSETLGDLIRHHAPGRGSHVLRLEPVLRRERVAAEVRRIVIEQLGISPEEYREDARFVEDFGIG